MGLGQKNLSRVRHLWFVFGYGKFPLKIPNFPIFFPSDKKWLRVESKKYTGQKLIGLFFTAGQRYARVGAHFLLLLINVYKNFNLLGDVVGKKGRNAVQHPA